MKTLAALLLVAGCDDLSPLVAYCAPDDCYPGSPEYLPVLVGECRYGNVECTDAGTTCVGSVEPVAETCNGLDDDCNGIPDNGLFYSVQDRRNDCRALGYCGDHQKKCLNGAWVCVPVVPAREEVCNGFDDDHDCETDEDLDVVFFYDEDAFPETVGIGECRPGVRRCSDGRITEVPPISPRREACNGRDDDCDGLVDEGEPGGPEAFLLVIDVSGSMDSVIDSLTLALCDFSQDPMLAESVFAIVEVAQGYDHPNVVTVQDFSDADATCASLQSPAFGSEPVTNEFMLSGVLMASGLSWPEDVDRTVVAFTDEAIQYDDLDDANAVEVDCLDEPYELAVFSPWPDWDSLITTCGGFRDSIVDDRYAMAHRLLEDLYGDCE